MSVPNPPTNVSAVAGNGQATVSWTAPTGGGAVSRYSVVSIPGDVSQPVTVEASQTSATVTGLPNGTGFAFVVYSWNYSFGSSIYSSPSSVVMPLDPDPGVTRTTLIYTSGSGTGSLPANVTATITVWGGGGRGGNENYSYGSSKSGGGGGGGGGKVIRFNTSISENYTYTVGAGAVDLPNNGGDTTFILGSTYSLLAYGGSSGTSGGNIDNGIAGYGGGVGSWSGGGSVLLSQGGKNGSGFNGGKQGYGSGGNGQLTLVSSLESGGNGVVIVSYVLIQEAPDPPTNVTAVAGNGQATVSWTAPANNGGSAIFHYGVYYAVTSIPGQFYSSLYRGPYRNVYGTGDPFYYYPKQVVRNSDPSTAHGGIPDYKTYTCISPNRINGIAPNSPSAIGVWQEYPVTTSAIVSGLTNGTSYIFTVVATNSTDSSIYSVPSPALILASIPDPPTNVSAVAGNGQATVSWTAPTNNGGASIEDYTITSSPGNFTQTVNYPQTSGIITGLTNGTSYTFTVTARNSAGSSSASSPSSPVTSGVPPGQPTNVSAVAGNAEARVYWIAPTNDGGATIEDYTITSSPGNFTNTVAGTERTATVTGLTNGTSYTFTVTARNYAGNSSASSPSNSVTPSAPPGQPTSVTAVAGNQQATVSWTAPTNNGGSVINMYTVTSSPGGIQVFPSSSPIIISALTNGTSYTFTVTANNSGGSSVPSNPSLPVTPGSVPNPPRNLSAILNNGQALVSWDAPTNNGGYAINTYTLSYSPSGTPVTISASLTSYTFTGLTDGTSYRFTVTANNFIGSSSPSSTSNYAYFNLPITLQKIATAAGVSSSMSALRGKTLYDSAGNTSIIPISGPYSLRDYFLNKSFIPPYTVPDVPTNVIAVAGNQQATVSWTAPANNGGTVIKDYTITSEPSVSIPTTSSTSATVTGLTNGTSYRFTVTARNDVGSSSPSSASSSVIPIDPNVLTSTQFIWVAPNGTGIPNFYAWDVAIPSVNGTYSCRAVDSGNSSRFFIWTSSVSAGTVSASTVVFTGFVSNAAIRLYSSPSYAYQYGSPASLSVFPTSASGYFCLDFLHQNPTDAIYILTVT
jgi:chitodextrinase